MEIAIGLFAVAVFLFLAVRLRLISGETLRVWADIAAVVAMLAAIIAFIIPITSQFKIAKPTIPPSRIYDDFNNPTFDGSYNGELWVPWMGSPDQIKQQDGVLVLTAPTSPRSETGLHLRKYQSWKLEQPSYFEAKLKLSSEASAGNIGLKIFAYLPSGDWGTQCIIEGSEGDPYVTCGAGNYYTGRMPTNLDTWHTVGIEIEPTAVKLSFYIDGHPAGSTVPSAANELREAAFTTTIGAYTPTGSPTKGHVDDVRVSFIEGQ